MGEFNKHSVNFPSTLFIVIFLAGLLVGGIVTYYIVSQEVTSLRNDLWVLESRFSKLKGYQNITYQNVTVQQNSTVLSLLYEKVKDSVVLIKGKTNTGWVQGSGFIYNYSGSMVVITNYHVVHGTTMVTIRFSDGNEYAAVVNGSDPYADLAVLTVLNASENEFKPLKIVSSSTLKVGEPVIAVGNPYGLVGSLTTGVVSALGRTITEEEYTGKFAIADIIQTSAPINPGNSGGPLINYCGNVVGITTAIIAQSQGLGFAIPSDTIIREIAALIEFGSYKGHSYLGLEGTDMDYETAQEIHVNVTYGWRVVRVIPGGPSDGKLKPNDVIIAMNGTKIRNNDELASYLEEETQPKNTVILTIIRRTDNQLKKLNIPIVLEVRPPPS